MLDYVLLGLELNPSKIDKSSLLLVVFFRHINLFG